MAQFIIRETQIVAYAATFEAETQEAAREMFLNGFAPLDENSNVTDSYGLTVELSE